MIFDGFDKIPYDFMNFIEFNWILCISYDSIRFCGLNTIPGALGGGADTTNFRALGALGGLDSFLECSGDSEDRAGQFSDGSWGRNFLGRFDAARIFRNWE